MYALYDVRTGRRLSVGPSTGAWGDTYGSPIFTGAEFHALLNYIKGMGFHVYANSHHGGINRTAHSPKSWHYVKDAQGRSLAADIGTHGDVNERNRIIRELIPLLDRYGVGWHYARDGHVPNHHDHIHIDVSDWGRRGGPASTSYGYFKTYKKASPLNLGANRKRKPRSVAAYYGVKNPELVKVVQRIVNVKQDGSYGPGTREAVKRAQRSWGVTADGSFGPATTRAYFKRMGVRGPGDKGWAVRLVQYIAGVPMDGSYGPQTTQAVKELQAWGGLTTDGYFGPKSQAKLII